MGRQLSVKLNVVRIVARPSSDCGDVVASYYEKDPIWADTQLTAAEMSSYEVSEVRK